MKTKVTVRVICSFDVEYECEPHDTVDLPAVAVQAATHVVHAVKNTSLGTSITLVGTPSATPRKVDATLECD